MQKIERWRVEELALLLSETAALFKRGDNSEWANVFNHFHDEAENIISKVEFNVDSLQRLVRNIKNCLSGSHYFNDILLWHEDSEERARTNKDFHLVKARLLNVLNELEKLTTQRIH